MRLDDALPEYESKIEPTFHQTVVLMVGTEYFGPCSKLDRSGVVLVGLKMKVLAYDRLHDILV